jgi:hypothetical protein
MYLGNYYAVLAAKNSGLVTDDEIRAVMTFVLSKDDSLELDDELGACLAARGMEDALAGRPPQSDLSERPV